MNPDKARQKERHAKMKNITPFKIICIGLPVILIVMVLLFSKGSDAKKERLESQLQTTWHSSEEGEYNEITLAEDGTYSASGAISGTGSYRIDRNNKWIILTAENGKKNVLYYTTGKGHKVESLSMKLTVGTNGYSNSFILPSLFVYDL